MTETALPTLYLRVTQAARLLGISRATMYRKLAEADSPFATGPGGVSLMSLAAFMLPSKPVAEATAQLLRLLEMAAAGEVPVSRPSGGVKEPRRRMREYRRRSDSTVLDNGEEAPKTEEARDFLRQLDAIEGRGRRPDR